MACLLSPAPRARLLYVITVATCGGAQAHVLDLLRGAVNQYSIALATGQEGFLADEARQMGIPVFIVPDLVVPMSPLRDARALVSLIRIIRTFRPDLVHAHSSKAGILARAAARVCGTISVFTAHGWAFTDGVPRLRRLVAMGCERTVLPCSDAIITVSEYDRQLALQRGLAPPGGVHCIHNGIADEAARAEPGSGSTPVVTMVARFCQQKDHVTLAYALAGLRQEFRLEFIGSGETMPWVRSEVSRSGIEERTQFLGERKDVPQLLGRAHIFALATNYEGLPISILEAMRAGLPIVASDVGGIREIVRDGVNGFLVPRGDIAALREALRVLLDRPVLRASMGARSRSIYEQGFTVEKMIKSTLSVYSMELNHQTNAIAELHAQWSATPYIEPEAHYGD
jgi:glycosyltransferase involved in cell wall biosynthesis